MSLQSLLGENAHVSRSLQVINNVGCVVRELVENAIDAKATEINIKLLGNGFELVQVSDNGSGICESNFEVLAHKHTTSKISEFDEIYSTLNTFGFRGEALNCISNVSTLEVETKMPNDKYGWLLKYGHMGELKSKEPTPTMNGTTVRCKDLFKPYPVRRSMLLKNSKSHISAIVFQLQQYALVNPDICISLSNKPPNSGHETNIFHTPGGFNSLREVANELFGKEFTSGMVDVDIKSDEWSLYGVMLYPYNTKQYKEIEIFYINKRPVDNNKKFRTCISDIYKQFSSRVFPAYILNLSVNNSNVDVNLAPDKRFAFICSEDTIIQNLKSMLYKLFVPEKQEMSQASVDLINKFLCKGDLDAVEPTSNDDETVEENTTLKNADSSIHSQADLETDSTNETLNDNEVVTSKSDANNLDETDKDRPDDMCTIPEIVEADSNHAVETVKGESGEQTTITTLSDYIKSLPSQQSKKFSTNIKVDEKSVYDNMITLDSVSKRPRFSLSPDTNFTQLSEHGLMDPSVFSDMEICGQFNSGFIITKLKTREDSDQRFDYSIYIIDQHAADEKAKFEKYNKSFKLRRQKLISPRLIELSPFHQQVVENNLEILQLNGFDTFLSNSNDKDIPGVYIKSFPLFCGSVLTEEDFVSFVNDLSGLELTQIQKYGESKDQKFVWGNNIILPRPSKIWNILANRACKSAIKLGDGLTHFQMKTIKDSLATLIHPWNCPHGRPSMKCLISCDQLNSITNK